MEAEDAMALSLITTGRIDREIMESAKLQAVKKSGLMELYMPEPVESLGGLGNLKAYLYNRKIGFTDGRRGVPKGIILTGLPGAGKSLSAKVTASIFDMPLLKLDFSGLKGSLVGESEQKIKAATALADAIGKCVIWIDEIEKAIGGVQSSNHSDGGTTAAMFGHLLTWMQETKSKVFIIATCNDMDDLLNISQGALLRRFDDIFFVDVPTYGERIQILTLMNERYGTAIHTEHMEMAKNWTGAEIEKFVKSSVYDGVDAAFGNIHPIYEQNKANIDRARDWAKVNARRANDEEVIDKTQKDQKVRKLKVS
jgi:SpoVK/Ycf46/Vps4 family AAA+-type ATPase